MESVIKAFLALEDGDGHGYGYGYGDGSGSGDGHGYGYGDGSGSGDGHGYGDGSGSGSGYGYGDGSGDGSGYGYGDGDGSGYGLKAIDGRTVYYIDSVPTVIFQIHGSAAKGAIVQVDLSMSPCFVAKGYNCFAHGETLHKAFDALNAKMLKKMPPDERAKAFAAEFKAGQFYPNMSFFAWHHRLTGSCEMGRRQFAKEHQIDLAASMTPEDFVRLTMNDFGRDVIQLLKPCYGIE